DYYCQSADTDGYHYIF
nr:immunoglobulin light chain junction region [Macaca mulatta]MOW32042.1 immunoglobulin light chain junction region [Macaca mulatta]MOW32053.1 immunoglobulin light chain junction region [Macaca mulatta]